MQGNELPPPHARKQSDNTFISLRLRTPALQHPVLLGVFVHWCLIPPPAAPSPSTPPLPTAWHPDLIRVLVPQCLGVLSRLASPSEL